MMGDWQGIYMVQENTPTSEYNCTREGLPRYLYLRTNKTSTSEDIGYKRHSLLFRNHAVGVYVCQCLICEPNSQNQ